VLAGLCARLEFTVLGNESYFTSVSDILNYQSGKTFKIYHNFIFVALKTQASRPVS